MTTKIRFAIMSISLLVSCAPCMQSASCQSSDQTGANGASGPADQNADHPRLRKFRERMMNNDPARQPGTTNPGILGAPDPKAGPGSRKSMDSVPAPGPGPGLGLGQGGQAGGDQFERRKERRERMLKRFDADGDGVLNDAEKAKMRAWMEERRAARAAREGQGGPGLGGPGVGPGSSGGQPGKGWRPGGGSGNTPN